MVRLPRLASIGVVLAALAAPGQTIVVDAGNNSSPVVSIPVYRAQIGQMRSLVQACRGNMAFCNSANVIPDERVVPGDASIRWDWLRAAISQAQSPQTDNRDNLLQQAERRLAEDSAELEAPPPSGTIPLPAARSKTDAILSRAEFQSVEDNPIWQKWVAKLLSGIGDLFGGAGRIAASASWLKPFIEWGAISAAGAGLLLWAMRTFRRQRVLIAIEGRGETAVWQRESANWAELARQRAAQEQWRDAVHCLYWASIVMLEGRRFWRQSSTRTPREYLYLLQPGTPQHQLLRRLTLVFERIWYGLRPAAEQDYTAAVEIFEQLRSQ